MIFIRVLQFFHWPAEERPHFEPVSQVPLMVIGVHVLGPLIVTEDIRIGFNDRITSAASGV